MAERQIGGFNYQENIIKKYNLIPDSSYTGLWDAYVPNSNIPVSIKHAKYGTDVELADFFRNGLERNSDYYMIVGFWENTIDNIIEEYILYIPVNNWKSYFNLSLFPFFKRLIINITNDKTDDDRWRKGCDLLKNSWKKTTNNLIRPRFKRDHKTQKRIQCAINNKDFYEHFISEYGVTKIEC